MSHARYDVREGALAAGLLLLGAAVVRPLLAAPAALLVVIGAARRRPRARDLLPAVLALAVALGMLSTLRREAPGAWFQRVRPDVEAAARRRLAEAERLASLADSLAARLGAAGDREPAATIAALRRWWQGHAPAARHPLGLVAWRDGERVAWGGTVEPFPPLSPGTAAARIEPGAGGWYRRGRVAAGGVDWEWQILLAGRETSARPVYLGHGAVLRSRLVPGDRPLPARWSGRPESGPRYVAETSLAAGTAAETGWRLQLTVQLPPHRQAAQRHARRVILLAALLYLLPVLAWAGRRGGWHLAAGLAAVRACWALLPLGTRALALAGGEPPAPPRSLLSLLDASYAVLPGAGGLGSSSLDLVLTAALAAVLAAAVRRAVLRRGDAPGKRRLPGGRATALVLVLALAWGWGMAVQSVAAAANPRLTGLAVPLAYPTFWALHLGLLGGGLAAGWLGLAAWAAAGGRRFRRGWGWLLPLPLVVLVNHAALTTTYDRMAAAWLRDAARTLGGDHRPEVRMLLGDLLTDITTADADQGPPPAAHARLAAPLWRDWRAFALWRRTAIADLHRPGRLELLAPDGTVLSAYAEGFLRDEAYEVVDRGAWESGRPIRPRPGVEVVPYFQAELRRYAGGEEWILRGEVARLDTTGWVSLEMPFRTARAATALDLLRDRPGAEGYVPRLESDRPLLVMRGDADGWRDSAGDVLPPPGIAPAPAALAADGAGIHRLELGGQRFRCAWAVLPPDPHLPAGTGLLVCQQLPTAGERLLDLSRLLLLDLLLAALLALAALPWWWRDLQRGLAGFQQRFLALLLLLGLLPLALAGTFIERLGRDWSVSAVRDQTRERLAAAESQLQSLLAEQARALAGSDYISDLLDRRLAGQRPVGPFTQRQAMVFADDGRLLLDETLSDLDAAEAALVLDTARGQALLAMAEPGSAFLGTVIPVDLAWQGGGRSGGADSTAGGPVARPREGFFFYRQEIVPALLDALAGSVGGEVAFYVDGEAVAASHPAAVFAGRAPALLPEAAVRRLLRQAGHAVLLPAGDGRDTWAGLLSLPLLRNDGDPPRLRRAALPAVLALSFPARERDAERQRQRTVLFLSGVATIIFLATALLGLVLAWRIFNPLRLLVEATRRLAAEDYAAPLPPPGRDEVGTLAAAFAAMRERLGRARAELAARRRFLERLLERVPVGVAVLDGEGRPVVLNPAMTAILAAAYGPVGADDGAPDDTTGDAPGPTVIAACRRLLADLRAAVPSGEGEAEWRSEDGRRILRGRVAPLAEEGLAPGRLLVVCEDVTEFVTAKRMAVSAQMARQVAHEVKNPLTPIQLSMQFLERAWRDRAENMDEIVAGTVRQVLRQVALLRSIATEFSLLGRPDELPCTPVDPAAVVQEVLSRYRSPGSDLPRVREEGGPPPPVLAHTESLARVLGNLMENSLHAAGGLERLELVLRWRITGSEVTLCWLDNGPGLSPEVLDHLFDPYFSTRSGGTGLGLPICRHLVSRMGGRFTLENRRDGTGAEARVTLRRAGAAKADGPEGGDAG